MSSIIFVAMKGHLSSTLVEKSLFVDHQVELCVAHMLCATVATPLVKTYPWRISICATHSLSFSGAYLIYAINRLCVVHMAICATDATFDQEYMKIYQQL
jgi:hypothetical protein